MFIFPRSRKVIIEVRIRGSNIHIDRFTLQARGVNGGGKEIDSQVVESAVEVKGEGDETV